MFADKHIAGRGSRELKTLKKLISFPSVQQLFTEGKWRRSEHAYASYPGLFLRPRGFSPYIGREERRVEGLDYMTWDHLHAYNIFTYKIKYAKVCTRIYGAKKF